jgi:hypothetical protein
MIKIDLSKAIPSRLGTYLLAAIPGALFESCIAVGDTHLAASVIARVQEIYPFGPYALLVLFLASALFIGQGFILAAWVADLLMAFGFKLWRYAIRNTLGSLWLYRSFGKLQGIPPKRNIFIRSLSRIIFWARGRDFSFESRPALKCLRVATERLLNARYGIETSWDAPQWDGSEWSVWYSTLGKPLKGFKEASLAGRTSLACGLAGFTALYVSPALRGRYSIAWCALLTFAGCFISVDLARWTSNPVRWTAARLKSIMLELSEVKSNSEKDPSVSIDPDDRE